MTLWATSVQPLCCWPPLPFHLTRLLPCLLPSCRVSSPIPEARAVWDTWLGFHSVEVFLQVSPMELVGSFTYILPCALEWQATRFLGLEAAVTQGSAQKRLLLD